MHMKEKKNFAEDQNYGENIGMQEWKRKGPFFYGLGKKWSRRALVSTDLVSTVSVIHGHHRIDTGTPINKIGEHLTSFLSC